MSADLVLPVAWVERGIVKGPAFGVSEDIRWDDLCAIITENRRIGDKDGCAIIPTKFQPEPDNPRKIRRLARNALARSAVVLDIEANNKTGEIPPHVTEVIKRISYATIVWTTHNHVPDMPRHRILVPLSECVDPDLPVVEVLAGEMGLDGVVDRSKFGPASIFYLPSAACFDDLDHHEADVVEGPPYDAALMVQRAGALLAERQAELERQTAKAAAEAEKRRQERVAAGADPDASLIEQIRQRLDLRAILEAHGYDKRKGKGDFWRHPNSQSGVHGANIKLLGGIDRFFSFNGGDPLHAINLPPWCTVTAVDAFDAACILDFGSDRQRALRELGIRFGFLRPVERKALARLIFELKKHKHITADLVDTAAHDFGRELGLAANDVVEVLNWARTQKAAA